MKKLFLISMLSLAFVSCGHQDETKTITSSETDADNTEKNIRDRNSMTKTPLDQSENEGDRVITQKIREIIIADDSLSTNAKNIKIITINGVVTLRGPVSSAKEKEAIVQKIQNVSGILKVDNQIEITQNK